MNVIQIPFGKIFVVKWNCARTGLRPIAGFLPIYGWLAPRPLRLHTPRISWRNASFRHWTIFCRRQLSRLFGLWPTFTFIQCAFYALPSLRRNFGLRSQDDSIPIGVRYFCDSNIDCEGFCYPSFPTRYILLRLVFASHPNIRKKGEYVVAECQAILYA